MKPKEAFEKLERLSPAQIKNDLLDMLEWQDKKGKNLVNFGWYLRKMFYKEHPRSDNQPRSRIPDYMSTNQYLEEYMANLRKKGSNLNA